MTSSKSITLADYVSRQKIDFSSKRNKPEDLGIKKAQLSALFAKYINCTSCPLGSMGRTQVVFGQGDPNARLMFVGEGPGQQEDLHGKPFVGRSGQLLTKIIQAMRLERETVYISNTVKCRPPQNRAPLPLESNTCKQLLLFKEIEIIQPQVICTLGASATKALLGDDALLSRIRGQFFDIAGIQVIPSFHPAYLLRNPAAKHDTWSDMKKIMAKLEL